MNKHLLYPKHPKFEPQKWNKNKYIKHSHNCYTYAMDTIIKKNAKACKMYKKLTKKHRKILKNKKKKKCTRKIKTWEWCDYNMPDKCYLMRPQPGLHTKTIKKFHIPKKIKKKSTSKITNKKNMISLEKMLLNDNPKIKKLKKNQPCPMGYYRIYLFPTYDKKYKMGDYHFIRQDKTGEWSEKWGMNSAKKIKEKTPEKYIINLRKHTKKSAIGMGRHYAVPIKYKKNLKNLM